MTTISRIAGAMLAASIALTTPASAMTIKEFRKFSTTEQGMYIGAAVNMLAYSYAANGEAGRASCIKNWYFGTKGVETPGPRAITVEISVAGDLDADKYHVEGVILGVTDKACGASAAKLRP
jgi:hypothetical protein